jgi:hypothetical protein
MPSGAPSFPRAASLRVRSAHMPVPFRPQSRGDELHATRRRLATAPVSTLGTSTDTSLTDMAEPIKPETMPLGTQTPNLWMTSQPTIPKEKRPAWRSSVDGLT